MIRQKRFEEICERFAGKTILVVGDVILDRYIFGRVSRISPEAPVPVVKMEAEEFRLGGAGNVCANINALGARGLMVGVTGDDMFADTLSGLAGEANLAVRSDGLATMVKTRVIAQKQQIVRIDREQQLNLTLEIEKKIFSAISQTATDGIIVSDYGKGTVTLRLMEFLADTAGAKGIPIIVDPKPPHFDFYKRVDGITPNLGEAEGMIRKPITDDKSAAQAARLIRRKYASRFTLITRGDQGITASEKGKKTFHMPVVGHEVFDVTGAGDTVVSMLTLALISGANLREAVTLANAAASIVIEKIGTSQTSIPELRRRIQILGRENRR